MVHRERVDYGQQALHGLFGAAGTGDSTPMTASASRVPLPPRWQKIGRVVILVLAAALVLGGVVLLTAQALDRTDQYLLRLALSQSADRSVSTEGLRIMNLTLRFV